MSLSILFKYESSRGHLFVSELGCSGECCRFEVCVDYGGVNVFHVCLDFGVLYCVGVYVNVCGVVCVVVGYLRLGVVCWVVM